MITPYLINVLNEKPIPCLWTKSVNIIPAKAPTGVKNAPKLDPIIVLYTAWYFNAVSEIFIIFENNTLIGILLIKLELINDDTPYLKIKLSSPKNSDI